MAAKFASKVGVRDVRPNPRVGCVIVRRGEVVEQGRHEKFGGPHAEVNAINLVPESFDWSEAEIYVTLEPCDHFEGKKTPSCTELLISKKPKKVVIGSLDPQFCGKNVEKLKQAGIEVEVVKHVPSQDLNPYFPTFITRKRPHVCVKMAMSLDGRISQSSNSKLQDQLEFELEPRKYITNEKSRQKVHEMRTQYSAILTTTETVMQDNPRLDVRLDELLVETHHGVSLPDLCVFGSRELSTDLNIFQIQKRQIHFFDGKDLKSDLQKIASLGYDSLFTECGASMATSLLEQDLVDEIILFIAPDVFGQGRDVFEKEINLQKFVLEEVQSFDDDLMVRFIRRRPSL